MTISLGFEVMSSAEANTMSSAEANTGTDLLLNILPIHSSAYRSSGGILSVSASYAAEASVFVSVAALVVQTLSRL